MRTTIVNTAILTISILLMTKTSLLAQPIIADHNAVEAYENIPQEYLEKVKEMWVVIAGESHSGSYGAGCELLEGLDSKFQCNFTTRSTPESFTNEHLRISKATWGDISHSSGWIYGYGEEDFFTSPEAIQRTKDGLSYCNENGYKLDVLGFGWCWDQSWINDPGGEIDPVYHTRWAGITALGPDGNKIWGLDKEDSILTGNRVNMDTYINAVKSYNEHCENNNYPTKVIYTTGPIDASWQNTKEKGYQRYLKNERIRNYVKQSENDVLFDFGDILSYNDSNEQKLTSWEDWAENNHSFPYIHKDNELLSGQTTGYHFGEAGALRIGKALWWLLARMAGWDGTNGILDTEAPETPTGVMVASSNQNTVSISWSPSTDNVAVVAYKIYRDNQYTSTSQNNNYSDLNITLGNTYLYQITAIDAAGNESLRSEILSFTFLDETPPSVPNGLESERQSTNSVLISWNNSTDNLDVTGYKLFRNSVEITNTEENHFTDQNIVEKEGYSYQVLAYDAAGNESEKSLELIYSTEDNSPPSVPKELQLSRASSNSIYISWNKSIDNIGVSGYIVYKNDIEILRLTETSFTDQNLAEGQWYTYQIRAFDAAGNESPKSTQETLNLVDETAPDTPEGFAINVISGEDIILSWNESIDNVAVESYIVYKNDIKIIEITENTYEDKQLSQGQTYIYQVSATDAIGNESERTNALSYKVPDTEKPSKPEGLTIQLSENLSVALLNWEQAIDNIDVTNYSIYRNDIIIATSTENNYRDENLQQEHIFNYFVSAHDKAGNESEKSNIVIADTHDKTAPTVPDNIEVFGSTKNSISLRWESCTDNIGVTEYQIFRDNQKIANSITTEYTDTNLEAGKQYLYQVSSKDAAGNESEKSSICEATTLSVNIKNIAQNRMMVFPNPSHGEFTIKLKATNAPYLLKIYNFQGMLIEQSKVFLNEQEIYFHEKSISKGIYLLRLTHHNNHYEYKIQIY